MKESVRLPFWVFESRLSQTNDFKLDTLHSLAWHSALLGLGKDWSTQSQDNTTDWDGRLWWWQPGVTVRQHYKVTMSVNCHKSVLTSLNLAFPTTVKHSFIPHQTTSEEKWCANVTVM